MKFISLLRIVPLKTPKPDLYVFQINAITRGFSGTGLMITFEMTDLKDSSPLYKSYRYCNDCNDKQDMYQTACMEP
jgi:hypothetical protein